MKDMCFLVDGARVGFMVAAPMGPVVILHMRMALLLGAKKALLAAVMTACSLGLHATLGGFALSLISEWTQTYAAIIQIIMGLIVLGVAGQMFWANKKLELTSEPIKTKLYYPAILSIICPFTTVLILNLLSANAGSFVPQGLQSVIFMALGTAIGGFSGYAMFITISSLFSKKFSNVVVMKAVKIAPFLILYYGVSGLWKGIQLCA